jgi:antitoxin (DNA-binding transcriptional repressor) of toxin-antitoxin stability system
MFSLASVIDACKSFLSASLVLVHFLVHNLVVTKVNIHDAKTNLSRYLAELPPGGEIQLCNRNLPVAALRSLRKAEGLKPRIGVAKGEFEVPASFFDPLPGGLS